MKENTLKNIMLDKSLENSFFHFTKEDNIKSIQKNGLSAVIGQYAKGIEDTPKIFFSKGFIGVLENCDVWLKWFMNKAYNITDAFGFYKGKTIEERKKLYEEWNKEFLSREYLNDTLKKEKLFEKIFYGMKKHKYLILNLTEGKEFKYNDIDEPKKRSIENKKNNPTSYKYGKEMYGSFSDFTTPIMDRWNMHTLSGVGVAKENIFLLVTQNNKSDMLSIIIDIYDNYKDKNIKYDLLDDFIKYAKLKGI